LALSRHNDYREGHEFDAQAGGSRTLTPLLTSNDQYAIDLQKQMNSKNFRGSASQIKVPDDCTMNMYEETGPSSAVADLNRNHAATDSWYLNGEQHYNYETGAPKDGASNAEKAQVDDFTRMVWRSTSTVSFGIKGKYVAAWYCA